MPGQHPGMGESAVRLLHRLPGTFPTLTTANCCPSAARCRQRHIGTRPPAALAPGRGVPGLGQLGRRDPATRYRRLGTAPAREGLTGRVDLDGTRHCPIGPGCESCGRLDELAIVTRDPP